MAPLTTLPPDRRIGDTWPAIMDPLNTRARGAAQAWSAPARRMIHDVVALLISLVVALTSSPAIAQETPHRPVPNFDGREEAPTDAGDVLIWVPRVVVAPIYAVTEYVIRWPLGRAIVWAEEAGLIGRPGTFGFYPTFLLEFNFRPSVGIYFYANDVPTDDDAFRFHFAWGGRKWWHLSVRQRFRPGDPTDGRRRRNLDLDDEELSLHFEFKQRPDRLFFGLGPDAPEANASRYFRRLIGGHVDAALPFGEADGVTLSLGVEDNELDRGLPNRDAGDVSIEEVFDVTDPAVVPGFEGYLLSYLTTKLTLDSRPTRPAPGTGARLELWGTLALDLAELDRRFLQYGGELSLFADVSGSNHTLSLRQYVGLVADFGDVAVPFTELEILGGSDLLRGFSTGRYHGASAFVSTLQYSYPIWVILDGYVFFEVGSAFGDNFSGFDFADLAGSFGLGLRTINDRDFMVGALFGVGTDTFDTDDFGLAEVRFTLGVSRGF